MAAQQQGMATMGRAGTGQAAPTSLPSDTATLSRPPKDPRRPTPTPAYTLKASTQTTSAGADQDQVQDGLGQPHGDGRGGGRTGNRVHDRHDEDRRTYSRERRQRIASPKDLPVVPTSEPSPDPSPRSARSSTNRYPKTSLLFPDDSLTPAPIPGGSQRTKSDPAQLTVVIPSAGPPSPVASVKHPSRHSRANSTPPTSVSPQRSGLDSPTSGRSPRRPRHTSLITENRPSLPSRASSLGGSDANSMRRRSISSRHSGSPRRSNLSPPGSPVSARSISPAVITPSPVRPRLAVIPGRPPSGGQRPRTAPQRQHSRFSRKSPVDGATPSPSPSQATTFITAPPLGTSSDRSVSESDINPVVATLTDAAEARLEPDAAPQTPPRARPAVDVWGARRLKRRAALRELVETEAAYARDLAVARDVYLAKAKGLAVQGWLLPNPTSPILSPTPPPQATFAAAATAGEDDSSNPPSPVVISPSASSTFLPARSALRHSAPVAPRNPTSPVQDGAPSPSLSIDGSSTASATPIKRAILPKTIGAVGFRFPKRKSTREGSLLPTSPLSDLGQSSNHSTPQLLPSPSFADLHEEPTDGLGIDVDGGGSSIVNGGGRGRAVSTGLAWQERDRQVVFGNLEEVASLAETFSALLEEAAGSVMSIGRQDEEDAKVGEGEEAARGDFIGACFLEMIPKLETAYMTYCAKYDASLARYEQLQPHLRSYLAACAVLAKGRTTAWDLTSLLIKPVQRCLKYQLLLQSVIDYTDIDHPDYEQLQLAKTQMVAVADAINETKRRQELVELLIGRSDRKKPSNDSSPSIVTSNRFAYRAAVAGRSGMLPSRRVESHEHFDQLAERMYDTLGAVKSFRDAIVVWSEAWRAGAKARVALMERMQGAYAGSGSSGKAKTERVDSFLLQVAGPLAEGLSVMLEGRVREEILPTCDQLIAMYFNPLSVIAKRNSKLFDARHGPEADPETSEAAQAFDALTHQLVQELPKFLTASTKIFEILVAKFATVQRDAYTDERTMFRHWSKKRGVAEADDIEAVFADQHGPVAAKVESFACTQFGELARRARLGRPAGIDDDIALPLSLPRQDLSIDGFATPPEPEPSPWRRGSGASTGGNTTTTSESFRTVSERRRSSAGLLMDQLSALVGSPRPSSVQSGGSDMVSTASTASTVEAPVPALAGLDIDGWPLPPTRKRWSQASRASGSGGGSRSSVATSSPSFTFSQGQASSHRTTASSTGGPATTGKTSPFSFSSPELGSAAWPALWNGVAVGVVRNAKQGGRSFLALQPGEPVEVWKQESVEMSDGEDGKVREVDLCFGRKADGEMGWVPAEALARDPVGKLGLTAEERSMLVGIM